jgi:aldehyde:ferredoxin oxidoreductase
MTEIIAVTNKVLDIDLTTGNISTLPISDSDRKQYLGGKGLALKLLYDHIETGVDPLSADNILVIMSGPATGTAAPSGGRFAVVSKSPLTGIFASSYTGGRFGLSLKRSGYDGILVRGKSDSPVYIKIDEQEISVRDASLFWGLDTVDVQKTRKEEGDWVVIGPAGENLVRFAVIAAGNRIAGRCGLGAVMGSKNLKGIVASGKRKILPAAPERFQTAVKTAREKIKSHETTGSILPEQGTPLNVMKYGPYGIMPVRNFSRSTVKNIQDINAVKIRDHHFYKKHGCIGCPIQCGRTGMYNNKKMISPEYETIGLLGSNLMISDLSRIASWNERLNRLGMDTISTGNVIGFAMELTENGAIESDLSFGRPEGIDEIIEDIAHRRGLGNELAEGVKKLSEKVGGKDYAIHVKGLEMAAYDPRGCSGQGLGYATANSGATHLSGSTHAIEVASYLSPHGTKGKAHFVKFLQDLTEAVNSVIFCIWTEFPFLEENFIYKHTPVLLMRLLMRNIPAISVATTDLSDYAAILSGLMGYKISQKEFYRIGERIFNLERLMNNREGIRRSDDTLPKRILKEVREDGGPTIELEKMLQKYYQLRGWNPSGQPRRSVLQKLDIQT